MLFWTFYKLNGITVHNNIKEHNYSPLINKQQINKYIHKTHLNSIRILELFLKDHVTEVMYAANSVLPSQEWITFI